MSGYIYLYNKKCSEWTVGFYTPEGEFIPESIWKTPKFAMKQVSYLNGGTLKELILNPPEEIY